MDEGRARKKGQCQGVRTEGVAIPLWEPPVWHVIHSVGSGVPDRRRTNRPLVQATAKVSPATRREENCSAGEGGGGAFSQPAPPCWEGVRGRGVPYLPCGGGGGGQKIWLKTIPTLR